MDIVVTTLNDIAFSGPACRLLLDYDVILGPRLRIPESLGPALVPLICSIFRQSNHESSHG